MPTTTLRTAESQDIIDAAQDTAIGLKADQATTYTKTELRTAESQDIIDAAQDTAIGLKADQATTYTKTESDNSLALKALLAGSATQAFSASTISAATGILFGADTAAANTLDDYEEGTWTPALEGSAAAGDTTYIYQVGRYEKIGREVTIRGMITVGLQGTLDGNVRITGLPFAANGDVGVYGSVVFGYAASLAITAGEVLSGYIGPTTTKVTIMIWNSTAGNVNFNDAELTNGASLIFSSTYNV